MTYSYRIATITDGMMMLVAASSAKLLNSSSQDGTRRGRVETMPWVMAMLIVFETEQAKVIVLTINASDESLFGKYCNQS
jgi:hypothetical protein